MDLRIDEFENRLISDIRSTRAEMKEDFEGIGNLVAEQNTDLKNETKQTSSSQESITEDP